MKLTIDISEELFERVCQSSSVPDMQGTDIVNAINVIKNGTPLPKGHGRLIDVNNLRRAFISWSKAVQGNFTDADIASIVTHSPTIIPAESED